MPKPEKTFRAGAITASIWATCDSENGEVVKRYTVRLQRSYKKGGTWKNIHVFFANDLPNVALVALEVSKYLRQNQGNQPNTNNNFNQKEV